MWIAVFRPNTSQDISRQCSCEIIFLLSNWLSVNQGNAIFVCIVMVIYLFIFRSILRNSISLLLTFQILFVLPFFSCLFFVNGGYWNWDVKFRYILFLVKPDTFFIQETKIICNNYALFLPICLPTPSFCKTWSKNVSYLYSNNLYRTVE